jgi:hypothetical protein
VPPRTALPASIIHQYRPDPATLLLLYSSRLAVLLPFAFEMAVHALMAKSLQFCHIRLYLTCLLMIDSPGVREGTMLVGGFGGGESGCGCGRDVGREGEVSTNGRTDDSDLIVGVSGEADF